MEIHVRELRLKKSEQFLKIFWVGGSRKLVSITGRNTTMTLLIIYSPLLSMFWTEYGVSWIEKDSKL